MFSISTNEIVTIRSFSSKLDDEKAIFKQWSDDLLQNQTDKEGTQKYIDEQGDMKDIAMFYENSDKGKLFIAEIEKEMIGFAAIALYKDGKSYRLQRVNVNELYRRKGIAKLLCETCIQCWKENGEKKELTATIDVSNLRSKKLCSSIGFQFKSFYWQEIIELWNYQNTDSTSSKFNIKNNHRKRLLVSIIGSAGRNEDAPKINAAIYQKMIATSKSIIENDWKLNWEDVTLVSGGAAFSDHLSVTLFQEKQLSSVKILLYFPCDWDEKEKGFAVLKTTDYRSNPGQYANYLHANFSVKCLKPKLSHKFEHSTLSLQELNALYNESVEQNTKKKKEEERTVFIDTSKKGFLQRNSEVAKSEYLIAFTFGASKSNEPRSTGTLDTWNKHKKYYPNEKDQKKRRFVDLETI
jgi:RimJ/RimL family protein N-acetyltransferase